MEKNYKLTNLFTVLDMEEINTLDKASDLALLLKEELNKHNYLYYIKDNPIISDAEYDILLRNLIYLERKFPELAQCLTGLSTCL